MDEEHCGKVYKLEESGYEIPCWDFYCEVLCASPKGTKIVQMLLRSELPV